MPVTRLLPSLQLFLAVLLVAFSIYKAQGPDRSTAPLGQHQRSCGLFIHREEVTRDNCTAVFSIASCAGRCASKSYPKLFYSR